MLIDNLFNGGNKGLKYNPKTNLYKWLFKIKKGTLSPFFLC
jgi:hypothetical protein